MAPPPKTSEKSEEKRKDAHAYTARGFEGQPAAQRFSSGTDASSA